MVHSMSDKPTTKEVIIDAAETVVARDGAGRLTIDAVAAQSGISKGGVLYHYPNKLALLHGMVERMIDSVRDDVATAGANAEAAGEPVLPHIVDALFGRVHTNDQVANALLAASAEHPDLLETACDAVADEFRRMTDNTPDPVLAQIIILAVDGLKLSELLGLNHLHEDQFHLIRTRLIAMSREMYA